MKPVEIEFLMRDNLTAGLDKSKMSVEQLLGAARRASSAINSKIDEQRKVIDSVNSDLGKMESKLQTMKPGAGQQKLLVEISACKKVLAEEVAVLNQLEQEHQQAQQGVAQLEQEYRKITLSEEQAAIQSKSLTAKIAEQKEIVKQVEADVRALQKAYKEATPGQAQKEALAELNAAKKALQEDKAILASLTDEQDKNKESNRRLAMQLRELQDTMTRMRLEGKEDSEEYRQMAQEAAVLADTLADVKRQTSILSNDDANLQGLISGVNGLSGAFTTATGVMSLFASENENLQKVQARLQSVMAITMGLQQMFNALNKDSAFRLVTVAKAKNLLTTANHRLATALGISNAAASALMATLTLGLSVVITGLIVAWNKFSEAQENAKRKAQELVEIESQGRAEMIKNRFEIETTCKRLKDFNGSKEEEKQICEELNRKYGETFGYYDTVAQWYDVLKAKAEQYIQMLFLQAKAQALVNKAVEADEKLNKHNATNPDDADSAMGWFAQMGHYMMAAESNGTYDGYGAVKKYNRQAHKNRKKELEEERDGYLAQAKELTEQAAAIAKGANIGGHTAPTKPTKTIKTDPKKEESRIASELAALKQKNIQAEVDLMKEGSEKKRRQLKENYEKEMAVLLALEQKWRDAQKGQLTKEQEDTLDAARDLAAKKREQGEDEVEKEKSKKEQERRKEELQAMAEYLEEYGSYQQRRLAITKEYEAKIEDAMSSGRTTEAARLSMEAKGKQDELSGKEFEEKIDWSGVFSDLRGHTRDYLEGLRDQLQGLLSTGDLKPEQLAVVQEKIRSLNEEINRQGDLFHFVGDRTREHNRLLAEAADAQSRLNAAREAEDGAVKTIASQLDSLKSLTGKDHAPKDVWNMKNPFATGTAEYKKFNSIIMSLKVSEAELGKAREATKKATRDAEQAENASRRKSSQAVADWFSDAQQFIAEKGIGQIPDLLNDLGLGDLGNAAAQGLQGFQDAAGAATDFMSGNYIGAALKGFSAIKNFGEALGLWKTSNREEIEAANKKLEAATSANTAAIERLTEEMKNQSPTEAYKSWTEALALKQVNEENARQTMENNSRMYDGGHSLWYDFLEHKGAPELARAIYAYVGKTPWDNSYDIGSLVHDLSGSDWDRLLREAPQLMSMLGSMLAEIEDDGNYNGIFQDILDFAEEYSQEAYDDLRRTLQESITGISFDSFKDKFKDALMDMSKTGEDFCGDFTEMLMQSVLNAQLEKLYGEELQELYDAWSNSLSDDNLSKREIEKLQGWQEDLVRRMTATRDVLASATGYDRVAVAQSGRSGAFATMSQEQGNKLEGLFVNGQMHWAGMDDKMTDVSEQIGLAGDILKKIEENTGKSAASLEKIEEDIKIIKRDGLKVK